MATLSIDTKEGWNGSRLAQLRSAKPAPPKGRAPKPYRIGGSVA